MATITGQEVWEAVLVDQKFAAYPQEIQNVLRPFITASPEALASYLDKPVTLQGLAEAKIAFLRYCINDGLGEKMAQMVGMDPDTVTDLLRSVMEMLEPFVSDLAQTLEEHGVTEEQVMLDGAIGLNDANRKKYTEGTLTIEEILRTQPAVILKNDE